MIRNPSTRKLTTSLLLGLCLLAAPAFTGTRVVEPSIETLRPYIDWTFFFTAWELKGRFPGILDHPRHGPAARGRQARRRAVEPRTMSSVGSSVRFGTARSAIRSRSACPAAWPSSTVAWCSSSRATSPPCAGRSCAPSTSRPRVSS